MDDLRMHSLSQHLSSFLDEVVPRLPGPEVVAYNFNLSEGVDAFEIELVGSTFYDPDDADWACEEAWTSRPTRCSVPDPEAGSDWEQFLDAVATRVREILDNKSPDARALWSAQAVTVGFVDGDLVRVGGIAEA